MPEITPIPLAELTTFRTGAAPERMVDAGTRDELIAAVREARQAREPWLVIGGGSNMLVGDEPFEGTVIRALSTGIERIDSDRDGVVRLRVAAGHTWDDLVAHTTQNGWAGIEAMSGIPGTVGAAPVQNIGAYGQEIVQTLVEVELIDSDTGEVSTVAAAELGLGFRTSVLKHHYGSVPEREAVILSVTLDVVDVGHAGRAIFGEQLRRALGLSEGELVPVQQVRERVLQIRRSKGMVLDQNDPDTFSAGSFFQNPVVSAPFARTLPRECPRWPVEPDFDPITVIPLSSYTGAITKPATVEPDVKVSAAWLIEHSGFRKGFRLPQSRAALSKKHALALTSRGRAGAAEITQLARYIQGRVQSEFGLILQPEPILINVEL